MNKYYKNIKSEEEAVKEAKEKGMEVVYGNSNTLLLDLDDDISFKRYEFVKNMVNYHFKILDETSWKSKSGNTHIKLIIKKELSALQRVALQAILGSDPKRECFGLIKSIDSPGKEPSLLFKPSK